MPKSFYLPDEHFDRSYHEVMIPFLKQYEEEVFFTASDGARLHACLYSLPASRSVICISHGFCEYIPKYSEVIYYMLKEGFSVAISEHRGHGKSERLLNNPSKVHIHSYQTYVEDYHQFIQLVSEKMPGLQKLLFAHSMGGCIGTLYLEAYPDDFKAAVLSSPMLEIDSGGVPRPLCCLYGRFMTAIGKGETYLGSQAQDFKDKPELFENSCCQNPDRFEQWYRLREKEPAYQTCSGTIEWMTRSLQAAPKAVRNASAIRTPFLLCQAEKDNMVLPGGQNTLVRHSSCGQLKVFPGAKHEIFNSTFERRAAFFDAVFEFFQPYQ